MLHEFKIRRLTLLAFGTLLLGQGGCGDDAKAADAGKTHEDAGPGAPDAGDGGSAHQDASAGDAGAGAACKPEDCAGQPVPAIACADGPTIITCTRGEDGACHAGVTCGGGQCDGLAGRACAEGEFCNHEPQAGGDGCDLADGLGVCEARPEVCPELYSPVCGCDLKSYSSVCDAHAAGVSVRHDGLCTAEECERIGGRAEYSDGASIPSCEAGEDSYSLPGIEPALCCVPKDRGALRWYETCGDPVCGGHRASDIASCQSQSAGDSCSKQGSECDLGNDCNSHLRCTDTDPTQGAGGCPISRAAFKRDIHYLSDAELAAYHGQIMSLGLARYTYKADASAQPRLGFIIEDVEPSQFVDEARDRVDLYAYTSAVVAALKVQQKQIQALEAEVQKLRSERPRRARAPGR